MINKVFFTYYNMLTLHAKSVFDTSMPLFTLPDPAAIYMNGLIELHDILMSYFFLIMSVFIYGLFSVVIRFAALRFDIHSVTKMLKKYLYPAHELDVFFRQKLFVALFGFYFYKFFRYVWFERWVKSNLRSILQLKWVEFTWTIIPMFLIFVIALPSMILLYAGDEHLTPEYNVRIIGNQWYWDYEITFTESTFSSIENPMFYTDYIDVHLVSDLYKDFLEDSKLCECDTASKLLLVKNFVSSQIISGLLYAIPLFSYFMYTGSEDTMHSLSRSIVSIEEMHYGTVFEVRKQFTNVLMLSYYFWEGLELYNQSPNVNKTFSLFKSIWEDDIEVQNFYTNFLKRNYEIMNRKGLLNNITDFNQLINAKVVDPFEFVESFIDQCSVSLDDYNFIGEKIKAQIDELTRRSFVHFHPYQNNIVGGSDVKIYFALKFFQDEWDCKIGWFWEGDFFYKPDNTDNETFRKIMDSKIKDMQNREELQPSVSIIEEEENQEDFEKEENMKDEKEIELQHENQNEDFENRDFLMSVHLWVQFLERILVELDDYSDMVLPDRDLWSDIATIFFKEEENEDIAEFFEGHDKLLFEMDIKNFEKLMEEKYIIEERNEEAVLEYLLRYLEEENKEFEYDQDDGIKVLTPYFINFKHIEAIRMEEDTEEESTQEQENIEEQESIEEQEENIEEQEENSEIEDENTDFEEEIIDFDEESTEEEEDINFEEEQETIELESMEEEENGVFEEEEENIDFEEENAEEETIDFDEENIEEEEEIMEFEEEDTEAEEDIGFEEEEENIDFEENTEEEQNLELEEIFEEGEFEEEEESVDFEKEEDMEQEEGEDFEENNDIEYEEEDTEQEEEEENIDFEEEENAEEEETIEFEEENEDFEEEEEDIDFEEENTEFKEEGNMEFEEDEEDYNIEEEELYNMELEEEEENIEIEDDALEYEEYDNREEQESVEYEEYDNREEQENYNIEEEEEGIELEQEDTEEKENIELKRFEDLFKLQKEEMESEEEEENIELQEEEDTEDEDLFDYDWFDFYLLILNSIVKMSNVLRTFRELFDTQQFEEDEFEEDEEDIEDIDFEEDMKQDDIEEEENIEFDEEENIDFEQQKTYRNLQKLFEKNKDKSNNEKDYIEEEDYEENEEVEVDISVEEEDEKEKEKKKYEKFLEEKFKNEYEEHDEVFEVDGVTYYERNYTRKPILFYQPGTEYIKLENEGVLDELSLLLMEKGSERLIHRTIKWSSYMLSDTECERLGLPRLLSVDKPLILPSKVPLKFHVTSNDVIHSFAVPAFGVKVDAVPGRINSVSVFIEREGIFYGQCSEICGAQHGFMPIQIIAVDREDFECFLEKFRRFTFANFIGEFQIETPEEPEIIIEYADAIE